MQAKYSVKVQAIRSKGRTDRFYVFIPLPLAAAIGLEKGEEIQWSLTDRISLQIRRVSTDRTNGERKKSAAGGKHRRK